MISAELGLSTRGTAQLRDGGSEAFVIQLP